MRTLVLALFLVLTTLPARADEVAPELETADLRTLAQVSLREQLDALAPAERRRLVGLYVAIDPDAADPGAQIACDDDGDPVVVVTDALLRLASHLARADEASHRLEDYAAFLVRTQLPGRRLLPPPPGFFVSGTPASAERLAEIVGWIVARELARFRAGDLACPRPTATRESGDAVWTAAERAFAAKIATTLYPSRVRDDLARTGAAARGEATIDRFFAEIERDAPIAGGAFAPSYARLHK